MWDEQDLVEWLLWSCWCATTCSCTTKSIDIWTTLRAWSRRGIGHGKDCADGQENMALKSCFGDMSYVELPTSKLCPSENPARSRGKNRLFTQAKIHYSLPYSISWCEMSLFSALFPIIYIATFSFRGCSLEESKETDLWRLKGQVVESNFLILTARTE